MGRLTLRYMKVLEMGGAVRGGWSVKGIAAVHVCWASTRLFGDARIREVVESTVLGQGMTRQLCKKEGTKKVTHLDHYSWVWRVELNETHNGMSVNHTTLQFNGVSHSQLQQSISMSDDILKWYSLALPLILPLGVPWLVEFKICIVFSNKD